MGLSGLRLSRSSPLPLYYQLGLHLETAIRTGDLTSGTILDGETPLAARLGLSRATLSGALKYLEDKSLVVRSRGSGTRVL